jgi:hypothetical protein
MIYTYYVESVKSLVLEFYENAWKSTYETRRIFEQIGYELTTSAAKTVPLLQNLNKVAKLYAGPIARAGCGLFRPSVIKFLTNICALHGITFESFGMGLRRPDNPLRDPAIVYWNTLRHISNLDLSSATILLYEMGEATGSTIEGAIKELRTLNAVPHNVIFLVGAAAIDQTRTRLEAVAPDLNVVIGSWWRYDEAPGPAQYYLTQFLDNGWKPVSPKDWGRCVSGMIDLATVESFIKWIGETLQISHADQKMLRQVWSKKIGEKVVSDNT